PRMIFLITNWLVVFLIGEFLYFFVQFHFSAWAVAGMSVNNLVVFYQQRQRYGGSANSTFEVVIGVQKHRIVPSFSVHHRFYSFHAAAVVNRYGVKFHIGFCLPLV